MSLTLRPVTQRVALTPQERLVLTHVAAGETNGGIARILGLAPATVGNHISRASIKLQAKSRATRVHRALENGDIEPPVAPHPAPSFSPTEKQRIRALARNSATADIAMASGISRAAVRPMTENLVRRANARNAAHLIALAHAWGLLPTRTS